MAPTINHSFRPRRLAPARRCRLLALGLGLVTLLMATVDATTFAGPISAKRITAVRVSSIALEIDGRLDESAWQEATAITDFQQKRPDEGAAPTRRTSITLLYDDDALYVGARMESPNAEAIRASLTRRDNVQNAERIILSLDSYRDRRTAYSFVVTALGVRADYYHPGDEEGWREYSYDPVWEAQTATDPRGWTAEMRIPFSQLRFNDVEDQVWGINFNRWVPSNNEDLYWVMVPSNEQGWSSRFGELRGIRGIQPSRRIEVFPYYANDATVASQRDPDDPFDSGRDLATRIGGDLKMGVGPNLTLEATVNPDFGQVEADPAEVNLSAYETFFSERRPFFIEGSQLLGGNGASYYYSRRIGAQPHGDVDGDYVERPDNTTILSATKLTGRLQSGLSIGGLAAITAREYARTYSTDTGATERVEIEPLAGYGVLRLQQEFSPSSSTAGLSLTGVHRGLESGSELAAGLNRRAFTGGADWDLRFRDGDYVLDGFVGFSHVDADAAALVDLQRNSTHYFQRPDATHVTFDSTRTSMAGYSVRSNFRKNSGNWLWEAGTLAESPGFEINDLGRLSSADDIASWVNLRYRQTTPGRWYRDYFLGLFAENGFNFGGVRQYTGTVMVVEATLPNYWHGWVNYGVWQRAQSDDRTRGGPLMGTGFGYEIEAGLRNNWASDFNWHGFAEYSNDELGGWEYEARTEFAFRPGKRWDISFAPSYERLVEPRQYVDEQAGGSARTYDRRYIFARVDRTQLTARLRLNYSFSPDLSLELYGEPFAASGRYDGFGELDAAGSRELRTYGSDRTTITGTDGDYTVTDGADSFTFEQDDFRSYSFRSNLVLRWEWGAGSTLYLVWQQDRSESDEIGDHVRLSSFGDAFTAAGDHFFAVKISYWLPVD